LYKRNLKSLKKRVRKIENDERVLKIEATTLSLVEVEQLSFITHYTLSDGTTDVIPD
jgi:uncharacterized membrane protein